jgi:thiol:disulfide interchange protein DsbD
VLLVFALSLFGVLRFSVNAEGIAARVDRSGGLARSAGEGVLAVIVATPCTAPFLGTAVGFALTGGTALVLSVFLAVGLGLAAPFLVLVLVPGAHRLLPRPGAWMHRLEAVLGFALLATVIWLIWLLGQVAGTEGIVKLLIFLLTVALGSWILGTWGFDLQASRRTRTLATWTALALVAATGTATLRFSSPRASAATSTDGFWTEWSPQAVDRALTEKRVVFVDFTADWCITCKVNEATVLERGRVAEALAAEGVAALKADWTERDARIRRALQRHGRAGVPLYLVFSPGQANDPQVLPEVLTADMVLDALRKARKQSKDDESA